MTKNGQGGHKMSRVGKKKKKHAHPKKPINKGFFGPLGVKPKIFTTLYKKN